MSDVVSAPIALSPSDGRDAHLRAKLDLESSLLERPDDTALQRAYFETLIRINRQFTGILEFRWPRHPYPLYFRCGSTDLHNFSQIFLRREYDFPLAAAPRRILDLGAYVGYAAIFLAHRFPEAEIVSVEPSENNFRLLLMNTAPYHKIRRLNVAVCGEKGQVKFHSSIPGDWGLRVVQGTVDGNIPAISFPEVLGLVHWDDVDLLKCDIEGAEKDVFERSGTSIVASVACCAIELHDNSVPGCEAAVSSCFDQAIFERTRSGEYHVFKRRTVGVAARHVPTLDVLRPDKGVQNITLKNVPPEAWGYYTFDGASCQLNATSADSPPAELATIIEFAGQDAFESEVRVENPLGHGVTFGLKVCELDDQIVTSACIHVAAGEARHWRCPVGVRYRPLRVFLSTRMVVGSPTNHQVRAFWQQPDSSSTNKMGPWDWLRWTRDFGRSAPISR